MAGWQAGGDTMAAGRIRPRPCRPGLADLSPAYFGLVMATGIVSLAAWMQGHMAVGRGLYWLNIGQYLLLCGLYAARALRHSRRFFADMTAHATGPGYFTSVAGTGVLAAQVILISGHQALGLALWLLALLLWLALTYAIFAALTVRRRKPGLAEGINGAWLLAVVATQALSVTGALLAGGADQPWRVGLNFLALATWLCGGMLYIWLMTLIFFRYVFFAFAPSDLTPPYWINMGAMAISTLAGALLVQNAPQAPLLEGLLPFLKGVTVLYWATGTWWIPMLLVLGWWRHVRRRFPLRYDPLYWGLVFPLGMYGAGTWQMDRALELGFLGPLARLFLYGALAAWTVTFAGMLHRVAGIALAWRRARRDG